MRSSLLVGLLAVLAGSLLASYGSAIRPTGVWVSDSRRFGLNTLTRKVRRLPGSQAHRAFSDFNRSEGGSWNIRYNPRTGTPSALNSGKSRPRAGGARGIGAAFLNESRSLTHIDPDALKLIKSVKIGNHSHLLYEQTYRGLTVAFSRVKVHLSDRGEVIGLNSTFEPDLNLGISPSLTDREAFAAVSSELGAVPEAKGELVIYPNEMSGRPHLAWKYQVRHKWNSWDYFVDAHTGQVLFRVDRLKRQVCVTSGTVHADIFDISPTFGATKRPIANQRVYVADSSAFSLTDSKGFFCNGNQGKIFTSLQGPFVAVSNFRGPSAHYDNGNGVWSTIASQASSPHPYTNNLVHISTINISLAAPNAVKVLPVFSSFKVGTWSVIGGLGDITDNDQVAIIDSFDHPIATYIGNRGAFNGAAVDGPMIRIKLRSNSAGTNDGYDVLISSYLTLSAPNVWNANGSSLTWSAAHTHINKTGEISLFYHLNAMHDFFMSDVNITSAAAISETFPAMAYVGPNLIGPFYDPDMNSLSFGDVLGSAPETVMMDDATVPRHEYSHFVMEKIFSFQNFGQAGAMSEGLSDYWAASSLDYTSIGLYYNTFLGFQGPLRELDCPNKTACRALTSNSWEGQIHADSIYMSQALWDIRKAVEATLITGNSAKAHSCVNGLVFQSLFFFPESFHEFYEAMLRVDSQGSVPNCNPGGGAANAAQTIITTAFANHGLPTPAGDSFERNDGFQTAVDITTRGVISATIFPAPDQDFYSFAAGPGAIKIKLGLPADGFFFKAYAISLYDRNRKLIAEASPKLDGFNTIDGVVCENFDCTTTDSMVTLEFSTTSANFYYIQIAGAEAAGGSNSGVNSAIPYTLTVQYTRSGAFSAGIVGAAFDNDTIDFTVHVGSFPQVQNFSFAYAQLLDQSETLIGNTRTDGASPFLTFLSSENALGRITGSVGVTPGFANRFPAAGTVHLEVFGYSVWGSTVSLGISQPFNLTASHPELTTYNTVFNPREGGKVTIKYAIQDPGFLTIKLYTLNGNLVKVLYEGQAPAGKGTVDWTGLSYAGNQVASGLYILRMEGAGFFKTKKIAVVK